ncbi:MAG: STT3 domain-containing protein, partial [Candidatus Nanohaloarchaea archaeon]|nr:STT3 domain-containing protein [Candidatus Nanohaloarchaea archaeon]
MASVLEVLREKTQSDTGVLSRFERRHLYWTAVVAIFVFAFWVRSIPASSMKYLQALDPYMIARMSASIVQNGQLPVVDVWRFFPYPTPTYMLNLGNIYIPAYMFYVVQLFEVNFLTWAKLYPALIGALAVYPMYLLGAEVFDRKTGVLSSFFLAMSAAIMQRSSAGWFEKEPIANLLMLFSMYFFARAWNRRDWLSGIASGLFLGVAATTWGGVKFLFLLYPLTVFTLLVGIPLVMLIPTLLFGDGLREFSFYDRLTAAYAPTALIGAFLPWILNGSASTWTFPNTFALANLGMFGFLAVRYGLSKYDLLETGQRAYTSLGMFVAGLIAVALSPLFSPWLYQKVQSLIVAASQSGGGVIAGTVAENAPASINSVISQLGAQLSAALLPGAAAYSEFFGGWTFGVLGASFLILALLYMVGKFYFDYEVVNGSVGLGMFSVVVSSISLVLYLSFAVKNMEASLFDILFGGVAVPATYSSGFVPAITIATFGTSALFMVEYLYSEEFEQWVGFSLMMWAGIFLVVAMIQAFEALALLGIAQGVFLIWYRGWADTKPIEINWLYVLIFLWIASTVYGAVQKSRLLFLAASPVAMVAGIGVARMFDAAAESSVWERLSGSVQLSPDGLYRVFVAFVAVLFVTVNVAAVYVMSAGVTYNGRQVGGIGGSPNQLWRENLEYMREQTPKGSVVLSWWDYGYWFETIGERPAVADGGNMAYYARGNNMSKINYPLADFLTSHNASKWRGWLATRSVDYIVLDSSMIGKYSAVSQISHESNQEFNSMRTLSCVPQQGRCKVSRIDNQTVIHYKFGRQSDVIVPIRQT